MLHCFERILIKVTCKQDMYNSLKKFVFMHKKIPELLQSYFALKTACCESFQNELSRVMRKPTFWFPTWSDTNQAVQLHKMARVFKFRIQKEERSYYLWSENKGAGQLRGYSEADLRLCFCICKTLDFS